ncbi:Protein aveugle [Sarcoptes scabiei]|uniref:Protein aveugle n=1 Tax=Sarcoptes scabiei TaxID=52283 RepID=A0A132A4L0_SARSC|nr:Protein aveugle [Sarcoptes scabiei]KPM05907.1 protein aveugle-like protein [Sarcoptes scabiei]
MINSMNSNQNQQCGEDLSSRRPRPVFFWSNGEVMKWLKRCCEEYYELYGDKFLDGEITGRSLIRINDETLKRMGIENGKHRDEIARIILKLKLKSDMIEIKDLERKVQTYQSQPTPANCNPVLNTKS